MKSFPFKTVIAVCLLFAGMLVAKKLWRDWLGVFERSWTSTFLIILVLVVTVVVIVFMDYREIKKVSSKQIALVAPLFAVLAIFCDLLFGDLKHEAWYPIFINSLFVIGGGLFCYAFYLRTVKRE